LVSLDQSKDTVRFDAAARVSDHPASTVAIAEETRMRDELAELQARLRAEAVLAKARRHQEARAREERDGEERARLEAQRGREEAAERAAAEARQREVQVAAFLQENGFAKGAAGPKHQLFFKTTYPLHAAAKLGNAAMVDMLLLAGASLAQRDSRGKTAAEVAEKANTRNSHAGVLRALAAPVGVRGAGGA